MVGKHRGDDFSPGPKFFHLRHRPIPERGYATITTMATGDPSTELEPPPLSLKSPVWKYFGFPVSYVDNVHVVDKKATVGKLRT